MCQDYLSSLSIMCQDTVTTTTALPVMVLCYSTLAMTMTVIMAPDMVFLTCSFGTAGCGSVTTADPEGYKRYCWPCHCATAATSIPDAYANYDMGSL